MFMTFCWVVSLIFAASTGVIVLTLTPRASGMFVDRSIPVLPKDLVARRRSRRRTHCRCGLTWGVSSTPRTPQLANPSLPPWWFFITSGLVGDLSGWLALACSLNARRMMRCHSPTLAGKDWIATPRVEQWANVILTAGLVRKGSEIYKKSTAWHIRMASAMLSGTCDPSARSKSLSLPIVVPAEACEVVSKCSKFQKIQ